MPTDSSFYIAREVDRTVLDLLEYPGVTITIKGYRQSGKSSLLARLQARAFEEKRVCCILDLQGLDAEAFKDAQGVIPGDRPDDRRRSEPRRRPQQGLVHASRREAEPDNLP